VCARPPPPPPSLIRLTPDSLRQRDGHVRRPWANGRRGASSDHSGEQG